LVSDGAQDETTRILALWSLEGIRHYDHQLMETLLGAPQDDLRREAVRSLQSFSPSAAVLADLLEGPAEDSNPMVRSEVLRTLDAVKTANAGTIALLVTACKPPLEGNTMGGAYERHFERYLARKALENYPKELADFIRSPKADQYDTSNLIWAGQALPKGEREQVFVELWKKTDNKVLDETTLILVSGMLENQDVLNSVLPILAHVERAQERVSLTLKSLAAVQSQELTNSLIKPIGHLLKSKEVAQQNLGLDAIGKLDIPTLDRAITPFIKEGSSPETVKLAMLALMDRPKENKEIFERIAKMETLDIELRASAIQALAKADINLAHETIGNWIPVLDASQKGSVIKILSNSEEGGTLLKLLVEKEILTFGEFDLSSAEKVFQSNKDDARGIQLFDQVKNKIQEERKAFDS